MCVNVLEKMVQLSPIGEYILTLPENIPREALIETQLKMLIEDSGEIKVVALVGGEEYTFTVEQGNTRVCR